MVGEVLFWGSRRLLSSKARRKLEVGPVFSKIRRFRRGRGGGGMVVVTVYSREGCGCCKKAKDVVDGFRGRFSLRVDGVDVDQSAELTECYGDQIPVIAVGGKVRFRGKVDPVLLERLLRAESVETKGSSA